ncbi:DUF6193 family natural product biosynthesis protein [Kitasatospora cinereorecta]|uniref:DUF6193 family natural product biosynthesis protein n=1 Tax=Kitasatospora cinereorecta TaxID=285560 RepID=A0ABW0VNR7_9ACTN
MISAAVDPDPIEPGDEDALAVALTRAAAELGLELPEPAEAQKTRVEFGALDDRLVVVVRYRDLSYRVRCRKQGAWLAYGVTGDLGEAARAVAAWTDGADLEGTRAAAPFVGFNAWALDHEREPFDRVEVAWRTRIDLAGLPARNDRPYVRALLEAAHAQPRLRRLMPVTSHFMLWFSATVEWPYERVGYSVDPRPDGFVVRAGGNHVTTTATAEEAVAVVVAHLPDEVGPAR